MYAPAIKNNKFDSYFGKQIIKVLGSVYPKMKTACQNYFYFFGFLFLFKAQSYGYSHSNPAADEYIMNDPFVYKGKIIAGTIK